MNGVWTSDAVLALAPDPASAQAGKGLATARKWVTLGRAEPLVWGECQGSGKDPYRAQIDLSEPAFKCSCPSRKFPCKHSLALFLLFVGNDAAVKRVDPPPWAAEWLAGRAKRAESKTQKAADASSAPADPAAAAKRAAAREKKTAAGMAELGTWLGDVARQGLAAAQAKPYDFWHAMAARLVDAQAPGAARLVREAGGVASAGEGWQGRLLDRLGKLHLLVRAYGRLDALSPERRADVRALVGWPVDKDELAAQPTVADEWTIVAQRTVVDDNLRAQRTWLSGAAGGRRALFLQFAHGATAFEHQLLPGTRFRGEIAYYPGHSMRCALRARTDVRPADIVPTTTIGDAIAAYAAALAAYPWLETFPLALRDVLLVRDADRWLLRDAAGQSLPIVPRFAAGWSVVALGGGRGVNLYGEWDGYSFTPLSARAGAEAALLLVA